MMEGLKTNWPRCRQVLLEALKGKTPSGKDPRQPKTTGVQYSEISEACKAMLLLGYPLEIEAMQEAFHEAYYRLIRFFIYRFGIRDSDDPSADDIFQNVFLNLHSYFKRGTSVEGPLAGYIKAVTINECIKAKSPARKHISLEDEDLIEHKKSPSTVVVPPEVVENWEYFDRKLLDSDQGNLINRIILAQQCIEACSTGNKPSARDLKTAWQSLKQMSKAAVDSLYQKTVRQIKQSPEADVAHIAAELINSGIAEHCQVTIVFAAATGMNPEQTSKLLDQLNSLSDTAIYARICRIYTALRTGMED
jgi:DNA-directed RNA polymerase specialized sigma24 family protein